MDSSATRTTATTADLQDRVRRLLADATDPASVPAGARHAHAAKARRDNAAAARDASEALGHLAVIAEREGQRPTVTLDPNPSLAQRVRLLENFLLELHDTFAPADGEASPVAARHARRIREALDLSQTIGAAAARAQGAAG